MSRLFCPLPVPYTVILLIYRSPIDLALVLSKLRYNTFERFKNLSGCHKTDLTLLNIHWTLRRRCGRGKGGAGSCEQMLRKVLQNSGILFSKLFTERLDTNKFNEGMISFNEFHQH